MEFIMKPIGIIHSPFNDKQHTPIQPTRSQATGWVEVFPQFLDGLQGLEEFSHIILLYVFHKSKGYNLMVKPFLDDQMHGLFTTRYPRRPNPIGLSTVQLLSRSDNILNIRGVDVLEGTPVLDIKPFFPDFDVRNRVKIGWYAQRSKV
jgi:tRNA-Thr(GGU) m(6)t(6)A37 methyltransferase TsaA